MMIMMITIIMMNTSFKIMIINHHENRDKNDHDVADNNHPSHFPPSVSKAGYNHDDHDNGPDYQNYHDDCKIIMIMTIGKRMIMMRMTTIIHRTSHHLFQRPGCNNDEHDDDH